MIDKQSSRVSGPTGTVMCSPAPLNMILRLHGPHTYLVENENNLLGGPSSPNVALDVHAAGG